MIGIESYGSYVPRYRIKKELIYQQLSWYNSGAAGLARGEKAVANHDEDTTTMAVAAAMDCMKAAGIADVDAVSVASMSFPFDNRTTSGIVAQALAMENVRTADYSDSTKSGTTALLAAADSVVSESVNTALVCASDCRVPQAGSSREFTYGDAAASFLLSRNNVIAELKGSYSLAADFVDVRQMKDDPFERNWEERWIRDKGYTELISKAVYGLYEKYNVGTADFSKILIACPNASAQKSLGKMLKANPKQMGEHFMDSIGDSGCAMPFIMLANALDHAMVGEKILLVSYGYGCDALYFETTPELDKMRKKIKSVGEYANNRADIDSYARYLAYKNLISLEAGIRGETVVPTGLSLVWRKREAIYALKGVKCKSCGTPQFPAHRVCVKCGEIDQMEPYSFAGLKGKVVSFTGDFLAFSMDPPQVYGFVDFPEGGRMYLDFTDCLVEDIKVGCEVEMTFRRKYTDAGRGYVGYFWKAKPVAQ